MVYSHIYYTILTDQNQLTNYFLQLKVDELVDIERKEGQNSFFIT